MRISDWSSDVCSSDLLRLNEGLACIIKRPDHAVDQVPFAFHSFCGHGENLFDAPLPDMRRNGHNSADALVHRYAVPGLANANSVHFARRQRVRGKRWSACHDLHFLIAIDTSAAKPIAQHLVMTGIAMNPPPHNLDHVLTPGH